MLLGERSRKQFSFFFLLQERVSRLSREAKKRAVTPVSSIRFARLHVSHCLSGIIFSDAFQFQMRKVLARVCNTYVYTHLRMHAVHSSILPV